MIIDVDFGDSAVERLLSGLTPGQNLTASQLLTALDGEDEEVFEQLFVRLQEMNIYPDINDLPVYVADPQTTARLRREQTLAKQGDLLEKLEDTDPLKMYLEEIAAIPAQGDVGMLAQQLKQGDPECMMQLLNLSLSRVVEIAREFAGFGVLLMDLIQEGSMALWEQLQSYTADDFEAFRDSCIRRSMTKAVILQAHAAGVGQKLREGMEDYRSIDEKLLTELGRNPTVEEIAEGLHITVEETQALARMLENVRLLNRAKQPEPEELPQEEDQAVEDTAYFQMRQRIADLLSGLSEQDACLLKLRYGLEGGMPLDPVQTGKQLGLTPEEVVAKEASILAKLRDNK